MSTPRHRGARTIATLLAGALGIAAIMVGPAAAPAAAHNELVGATPADGSTLAHLPQSGRLRFHETVQPDDVTVSVGRTEVPVTAVPGNPRAVDFDLGGVDPADTVVVTWTVVDSHDGHRSGGALRLHITKPSPTGRAAAQDQDQAEDQAADQAADQAPRAAGEPRLLRPLELASRITGYLAMALFVGGLLFLALLWPAGATTRPARAVLALSLVAGLIAAAGSVGVVLWRSSGQDVGEALATDYGRAATSSLLVWLLGCIVVAAVLQLDERAVAGIAWRVGAVAVSAGLIRVAGINAHATQGDEQLVGIAADFLHLTAMSAWVGGLVMLTVCLLPRRRLDELAEVVPRFSVLALVSVLTIVSSGLLLVWEVGHGIDHFWSTHYARVLMLKLAVFALVMLAAMKSKRWVQLSLADAVSGHRRTAVRSFAISVATETVLVLAVLAAASVLVTSSPGT